MIWTVGHSDRTARELLDLLASVGIELLVDIRAFPGSRRQPWFGTDALATSLDEAGIGYRHVRSLGGRRRLDASAPASVGDAWRSSSFRAYAHWTQGMAFGLALDDLIDWARERRVAVMCSEAVPWRCHRWLVSDCLTARGLRVLHLIEGAPREHLLSPFAVVDAHGNVTWPGPPSNEPLRLGPRTTKVGSGA
jgi:uncharacterized protein (DUF488 family)